MFESELVQRFVERTPESDGDPFEAIKLHIQRARSEIKSRDLNALLPARCIKRVDKVANRHIDAFLEPLGSAYADGFVLSINSQRPNTRIRFSLAHELCHTFFYEVVPELKFTVHEPDLLEERLCNYGAAELLLPASEIEKVSRSLKPSFQSLDELCNRFGVSSEVVIIHLRNLQVWPCDLSIWVPGEQKDSFVMERFAGWKKRQWRWVDSNVLYELWNKDEGHESKGWTALFIETTNGTSGARYVHYVARRNGDSISVLWSHQAFSRRQNRPLLEELLEERNKRSISPAKSSGGCERKRRAS